MALTKRINGLSNIHVAKMQQATNNAVGNPSYETPVPILGAISANVELSYGDVAFYADNIADYIDSIFERGTISLEVSGLTIEEYSLLFGMQSEKGGITASNKATAPTVAVLFESKKLGTNETRKYVIYNCKFKAPSLEAVTNKGTIEESSITIEGQCAELVNGKQYAFIDTDAMDADELVIENWYTEVQFLDAITE